MWQVADYQLDPPYTSKKEAIFICTHCGGECEYGTMEGKRMLPITVGYDSYALFCSNDCRRKEEGEEICTNS